MRWGFSVFCFLTEICMTSTTISTCWPTFCTMWARPSIRSSTTWCQPPTARSSSPHYATSACPFAIHPGGNPTRWPATPLASPATTPSPPTSSKRRHTDWTALTHCCCLETVGTGWSSAGVTSDPSETSLTSLRLHFTYTFYNVYCV